MVARQLYTLAYPVLSSADRRLIDDWRNLHDLPNKDVVAPHFTIGFGCDAVPEESYIAHVDQVARQVQPIEFHCRYAMFMAGADNKVTHVMLVPDEGHAAISLLHDCFYTGPMLPSYRLDIPYVPHITIATLDDYSETKRLRDELNATGISIAGSITALVVGALGNRIEDLATFALGGEQA